MNQQLQKVDSSNIATFSNEKIDLLKKTVCKGATNDELELFMHLCTRTGLDPFARQIYAVKRKDTMTIQTGIDGYRLIAERTGRYAPGREPSFSYDKEGRLISATSFIKKQTKDGSWHEVAATAFYSEYVQTFYNKETRRQEPSQFWQKMGHTMTAKCAEALALRKAFPDVYSGIYTSEEMQQASNEDISQVAEETLSSIPQVDYDKKSPAQVVVDVIKERESSEFITEDEGKEVALLVSKCSKEYQDTVWKFLNDIAKVTCFNDLNRKTYNKIKERTINELNSKIEVAA